MAYSDDKEAEKRVKAEASWDKVRETQIDSGFSKFLSSPDGRASLWWLLEITGVGLTPWRNTDRETAFAIGELNIGQQLLARITTLSPDAFITMQKEQLENARARAAALTNADTRADSESDA